MRCHWSRTDWEKFLPSTEYGVMIERTVVGPDALVGSWRRVSQGWRRSLEMLLVMMSNEYFLARRDIARELSSFCSK